MEHITLEATLEPEIAALRPTARRRYWVRQVLNAAMLPAFAALLLLSQTFDLTFFLVACAIGGLNFVIAMGQRKPVLAGHRDALVPLVLGLDGGRRRIVRRAVRTAKPSADPVLQYVELLEARRLSLQYRTSVWSLGIALLALGVLVAAHLADGDSATVALLAALSVCAVVAGAWSMIAARGAMRYLERLGYDPRTMTHRDDVDTSI